VEDLLDQHRRLSEISDDEFAAALRLFYDARAACSLGRFDDGLSAYEAIPLGRPRTLALR